MVAVDAGVDDRHLDRIDHRQLVGKRIEGVILREVVLPGRQRIGRREARAQGQRKRGRRQHERQRCSGSCLHDVETCRTGEGPATKPWPEPMKAR